MTPATDEQKLFIFRLGKLATDENRAVIEGVTKAFGLINNIDTTLTEAEVSKFDAINFLEAQRGDTDRKHRCCQKEQECAEKRFSHGMIPSFRNRIGQ